MIRYILIFLLAAPAFFSAQSPRKSARILFLGNSYTYYNNLPAMLSAIAEAQGDSAYCDSNTPGGFTFQNHYNNAASKTKIAQGNWDYVILQGQSQEPSFSPAQVNAQTLPYVLKLDSLIKSANPCAVTIFYETWGRKNGDAYNCAAYPPVCTYTGMQNRLRDSYRLFADSVKGIMAPVGEAFRSSISFSPSLELYDPDQSHPALSGSYLAALVFYESIFQRSALTNTYNPGIGLNALSFLQQVAHSTVTDSLSTWNQGRFHPWADFKFQGSGLTFQFTSASPALSNQWYFGDGNNSSTDHPLHQYQAGGTYSVSHVTWDTCKRDSVTKVITAASSVNITEHQAQKVHLSPNPCGNYFEISKDASLASRIEIRELSGRLVYKSPFTRRVNTMDLRPGIYFLSILSDESAEHIMFSKTE